MVTSKLKIKLVFNLIYLIFLLGFLYPNSIYINNNQNLKVYLVPSYSMNKDIKDLYDYSFDLRFSKKYIEFSYKYYVNKQNLLLNDYRDNIFNLISLKYYYKNKHFILGASLKNYQNYKNLDDFNSLTILISKNFYGFESKLDYYPYIEYERGIDKELSFVPDYLFLGCVIKDGDVFVEPFVRFDNTNKEQYSGIKIGIEI